MTKSTPDLGIVVPCFNEDQVLPETTRRLIELLSGLLHKGKIGAGSRIWYIDDGSSDRTWELIEQFSREYEQVCGIKLSRNRGHQNALIAGLINCPGDALISVDADLQDDINVIHKMLDELFSGKDIVYAVRESRDTDTFFKRTTAQLYYRMLRFLGVDLVFDHADFRLMSRRAVTALREFSEVNLFLRGIIPTIGFPSAIVGYDRQERFAGETKYSLKKMISLAIDGITSFSATPLRIIATLGLVIFFVSMFMSGWVLWIRLFTDQAVPGWASSVLPMYLLGGVQLLCLGIVGEYVAKVFMETKRRPRFFIDKVVGLAESTDQIQHPTLLSGSPQQDTSRRSTGFPSA